MVLVSGAFAFFLSNFNIIFWSSFLAITVVQIACWNTFQYIQQRKIIEDQAQVERQIIRDLTKQSAAISCASCGKQTLVPIRFDTNNKFNCEHCDKLNAVYIEIESAITTQPVKLKLK
jgi:phage FluMu protein Com